jgi:hypothetical protein
LNLPLCLVERLKHKERPTHTLKSIMHKYFAQIKQMCKMFDTFITKQMKDKTW